jgi:DNA repair protein RecN (Recombination protein N)
MTKSVCSKAFFRHIHRTEMLTTLRIKNLALVTDLTLELEPGYNVITGETGAGKSMLIGALSLVLGERAERSLIRSGTESCSVEAVFDVRPLEDALLPFLEQNGLEACVDHQLILKRTFTLAGGNRQFVNGSPASLNTLAALGEWLVDIHGPHEHQSLLQSGRQLAILDAFGKLEGEREAFAELLRRRGAIEAQKAALVVDDQTYARQLDLLRFQANEIAAARLQPQEEEDLEREYSRASNAARLLQLAQIALGVLAENEGSVLAQAGLVGRSLQELGRLDTVAAPLQELHEQAVSLLNEMQTRLTQYADKLELDPARLQQLEERLNLLHSLKRKYGASIAEVIAFGEDVRRKLENLERREEQLARLNAELDKLSAELSRAGEGLSAKRRKVVPRLTKEVAKQLAALGFKQSRFDVAFTTPAPSEPGPGSPESQGKLPKLTHQGMDAIEFQFAPNAGEPARPLRAIASSGELARVMLALKTVLAAEDRIPVLIFDEVDANVGGETANAVGEKMRQIARDRQVLCITHLPQVAAPASAHYVASKQTAAGRTVSEITRLGSAERVTELARMLGGQTEAARKHAESMLERGKGGR